MDLSWEVDFRDLLFVLATWGGPGKAGACCFADRQCEELLALTCFDLGGSFQGDGTECEGGCPVGACCFADGICAEISEFACVSQEGEYRGEGTTCEDECPVGACCLPDDRSCLELSQFACDSQGGIYHGDGTTCQEACPVGACCLPDERSCMELSEFACDSQGGVYQGEGTTCQEACPIGACCFRDGHCTEVSEFTCVSQGGVYQGEGTTCDEGCPVIPRDNCEDAPLVGDGSYQFSTNGSSDDGPRLPPECDEGDGTTFRRDVWIRYLASCTGVATASVCDSDFNTKLAVYAVDPIECPGSIIACSDDACGENGTRSEAMFPVVEGEEYLVRIGGRTSTGTGTMVLSCTEGFR